MIQLNLGCGAYWLPGWTNYDVVPHTGVIQRDLLRPLPEASGSVSRIFTEHFLEHLTKPDAWSLLTECHRVLAPGGRIRIVMPDLRKIAKMYLRGDYEELKALGLYECNGGSFCNFFNQAMRDWGHQYLWDEQELYQVLATLGFRNICSLERDQTDFPGHRNTPTDFALEAEK